MGITNAELKTELTTDPMTLGYAPYIASGNHLSIADLMNTVGLSGETIKREAITQDEFLQAIVYTEYAAITAAQRDYLATISNADTVDITGTNVKDGLWAVFGSATTTRANFNTLQTRPASRAEKLGGKGYQVTTEEIAKALRS